MCYYKRFTDRTSQWVNYKKEGIKEKENKEGKSEGGKSRLHSLPKSSSLKGRFVVRTGLRDEHWKVLKMKLLTEIFNKELSLNEKVIYVISVLLNERETGTPTVTSNKKELYLVRKRVRYTPHTQTHPYSVHTHKTRLRKLSFLKYRLQFRLLSRERWPVSAPTVLWRTGCRNFE